MTIGISNNNIFPLFISIISVVNLLMSGPAISYSQSQTSLSSQSSSDFQFPKLFVLWGGNEEGEIPTSATEDNYSEKPLKLRGIKTGQNTMISPDYEFPSNEKGSAVKSYPTIPQNVKFTVTTTSLQGQQKASSNNIDVDSVAISPILSQDTNGQVTSLGNKITLDPIAIDSSGILGYSLSNQKVGEYVLNVYVKPKNSPQQSQEQVLGGYETRLQILPAEEDNDTTTTTRTTTITKRTENNDDFDVALAVAKNIVSRGSPQTTTVTVSDADSKQKIEGAKVDVKVRYASGSTKNDGSFSGNTDNQGQISYTWKIGPRSNLGTFTAIADITAPGYGSETKAAQFTVIAANKTTTTTANVTKNNNTAGGNETISPPILGDGPGENDSFAILPQPPDACLENPSLPECPPIDPCLEDPSLDECKPDVEPCDQDSEACAVETEEDEEVISDEDDDGGNSGGGDDDGGNSGGEDDEFFN